MNLKEIEVSDYYLWHIRVIAEIQKDFYAIPVANKYGSVWLFKEKLKVRIELRELKPRAVRNDDANWKLLDN